MTCKSDFASDSCVLKDGIDPATGTRYLEELAFEIVSEQTERDVSEKAVEMHQPWRAADFRLDAQEAAGLRMVLRDQSWRPVGASISDRCLACPLPSAALLDAAEADNAVVEALAAKGNPALQKREAAAKRALGLVKGQAESILKVLAARGITVSERSGRRSCSALTWSGWICGSARPSWRPPSTKSSHPNRRSSSPCPAPAALP